MTEQSQFWTTNGTGHGLVGGYTLTRWLDFFRKLFNMAQASEGVIPGVDSELAVSGSASPLAVAAGAALVYGFAYENTASLNLTVTTPAALTGGRVVLEANWAAQTVTAKISQSASGVTTPPALVQSAGTTWQISLATYTITSGGAITLTDTRGFVHHATRVSSAMLDTGAVTAGKIGVGGISAANQHAAGVVDSAALAASAVTAGKIAVGGISAANQHAAGVVDSAALASGAVTAGKIASGGISAAGQFAAGVVDSAALASGAVTLAKHAADSVDDTVVGSRVPMLRYRQGDSGAPNSWFQGGATNTLNGAVKMQAGASYYGINTSGTGGTTRVTFPEAFAAACIPLILVTVFSGDAGAAKTAHTRVIQATNTYFDFITVLNDIFLSQVNVQWLAIGQE